MRWVIGDIHGMLRPLQSLLAAVRAHDPAARFVFAGDYVNRGPDSRRVIDLLLSLPDARFARGNHDDVLDLIVNGASWCGWPPYASPLEAFIDFIPNRLAATFLSYGASQEDVDRVAREPTPRALRDLTAAVPAEHRRFLRGLPPVVEYDDAFVAHAALPPASPDGYETPGGLAAMLEGDAGLRRDVIWGRFSEPDIRAAKRWRRPGFFGHTPVQTMWLARGMGNVPIRGPQITLLDTGAAFGPAGRLSAVCIEQGTFLQSDPGGRVIGAG